MSIKQSVSIVVAAVLGGIIGASFILSEVRAQAALKATPLTATSLDIVDSKGAMRCRISAEGDEPSCEFFGRDGKSKLKIGLHGAGAVDAPKLTMTDSKGVDRLTADVEMIGGPAFNLFGKEGIPRASLSVSKGMDEPSLCIYGTDSLHACCLGIAGGSPTLGLWDGPSSVGGGASVLKGSALSASSIVFVDGGSKAGFTSRSGANNKLLLQQVGD
ncbi:MAG: hypothetical protein WC028_28875 [Candidatus Obscuribacterales bacterium]